MRNHYSLLLLVFGALILNIKPPTSPEPIAPPLLIDNDCPPPEVRQDYVGER